MSCGLESTFSNTFLIISWVTGLLSVNLRYLNQSHLTLKWAAVLLLEPGKDPSPTSTPPSPVLQRGPYFMSLLDMFLPTPAQGLKVPYPKSILGYTLLPVWLDVVTERWHVLGAWGQSLDLNHALLCFFCLPAHMWWDETQVERGAARLILLYCPCGTPWKPECFKFEPLFHVTRCVCR